MPDLKRPLAWEHVFQEYCASHDFSRQPLRISAEQIKTVTSNFEPRILAKMDTREDVPPTLRDRGLFVLPIRNGLYVILEGEGFHDLEEITSDPIETVSHLDFQLRSARVGNSEAQHVDYAFNVSLLRRFVGIDKLYLQIRGRKYTPRFEFRVGNHHLTVESVQTEVDGGFEGRDAILLVESKNVAVGNFIIRQLYYPFRQWRIETRKPVRSLFFSKQGAVYRFWEYAFDDETDYNSIRLVQAAQYRLREDGRP
jgi:hypothetical protein